MNFAQTGQLSPISNDPKQQDQWTTFVEYLAFECFRLSKLSHSVRKLRPQHDAEWEKLVKAGVVGPFDTCDDLASTEARVMRLHEFHEAVFAARALVHGSHGHDYGKEDVYDKCTWEAAGSTSWSDFIPSSG
ncbi:unnamed protein product [Sordaria macrospora k-hell]|uniref:WGS project CABT00000000 data, contig 2.139 n=2 Tax=Sordaria macrospora TaxID=5147 RepID=F7WCI5_SORMK|nr:uncharacterized protein SMAC_09660 [Sordaria macrospora k-hell]CCC05627.1 unnamed protein product [Sordaria macrospora k-hell]